MSDARRLSSPPSDLEVFSFNNLNRLRSGGHAPDDATCDAASFERLSQLRELPTPLLFRLAIAKFLLLGNRLI